MVGVKTEKYYGVITDILDTSDSYKVIFRIPGVGEDLLAYPGGRESDEPNIGDIIIVEDHDPVFHSYFSYTRISENTKGTSSTGTFQGTRSRGNSLEFHDDYIQVGNYKNGDYNSNTDSPLCDNFIKITKEGDIIINAFGDSKISINGGSIIQINSSAIVNILGNSTLEVGGNLCTRVHGNYSLQVDGSFKVQAQNTIFTGLPGMNGVLETKTLNATQGAFNDMGDIGFGDSHPVTNTIYLATSGEEEITADKAIKEENYGD